MTPHWSASFRTVTSLLTDRRLSSWLSGAVLTTWSWTCSKQWRWSWTSGDFLRQLRKFNLPQELLIKFYSAIIESVLCTSRTVWFSSATKSELRRLWRVVRTAEWIIGTTLPTLQELYSSRVRKRLAKSLWTPHIQHTPSLNCYRFVDTTEHQNDQTQEQFLSPSNRSHEHFKLNMEHTTLLYNYLFTTHTYVFISNFHMSDLTHNCLYCILCFCHFVHCLFVYLYIVLLLSVSCPCHYKKFPMCKHTWPIKLILILISKT